MIEKMIINMNYNHLFLGKLPCGKTYAEVKVGRKKYNVEIIKTKVDASVARYDITSESKYCADLHFVHVKPDAIIEREFIERICEIEKAKKTLAKFADCIC